MSKMEKILRIRMQDAEFLQCEAAAKAEDRTVSAWARRILVATSKSAIQPKKEKANAFSK